MTSAIGSAHSAADRISLHITDLPEANDRARKLHAEWADKFAAMRREDNPARVTHTPALVTTIAAEVRRWVLEADDNLRAFQEGPRALVSLEERCRLVGLARQADDSPLSALLRPKSPGLFALTIAGAAAAEPDALPEHDPLGGILEGAPTGHR